VKIGIDLRPIVLGRSGGIAPVMKGILEALFVKYPQHQFLLFCTVFNRNLLPAVPAHVKVWSLPCYGFSAELDRLLRLERVEVLFRCYPQEALDFPSSKQVIFVPDLQHEFYPEFFSPEVLRDRRLHFNRDLSRAGAIGTLTEYARQTILEHKWTVCRDIFLMSPALQLTHQSASANERTLMEQERLLFEEYFLYPANLWPHKNHHRVLQAFELFLSQTKRPMGFIFTGHPEGWTEILRTFPHLTIRHLGFVNPQLLRALYEGARALVFFSLYEGFGMPLLEAFSARTPVICSNTTSLPEVGGNAVLTCDPTNIHAMSALMAKVTHDEEIRNVLIANGEKILQNYTWERLAENLLAACQRVRAGSTIPLGPQPISVFSMPRVSIVTPSYNQGRFIKQTIDSVLNQSYGNIEYLVVDGQSTDETISILKSYGSSLNWISEADKGQTDAINKGLARSTGEIRSYLNSDDVLLPDAVEKIVKHFRHRPDLDLVYGQGMLIDEQGHKIGMYETTDYSFERLVNQCCICQPAAFWRTRIAEKIGPFDDQLDYAMDYDYWLRIDRAGGRIEHLHETLAAWRRYPETKTSSARDRIFAEIFKISYRHSGFVSSNWFYSLWHHWICERNQKWPRRLLHHTGLYIYIAYLHHIWFHRNSYDFRGIINQVEQEVTSGNFRPLKPLWAATKPIKFFVRSLRQRRGPVYGFWSDNWIEPKCTVHLTPDKLNQPQRLTGVSPVDNKLRISVGGEKLGTYLCPANQLVEVSFTIAAAPATKLVLEFSEHAVGLDQRRLAFLLESTNLFDEQNSSPLIKESFRTPVFPSSDEALRAYFPQTPQTDSFNEVTTHGEIKYEF
jgi:glycosyltransferase involved in cell wall biosynthesis